MLAVSHEDGGGGRLGGMKGGVAGFLSSRQKAADILVDAQPTERP